MSNLQLPETEAPTAEAGKNIEEVVIADKEPEIPVKELDERQLDEQASAAVITDSETETKNSFLFNTLALFGEYISYVLIATIAKPVKGLVIFFKFLWRHTVLFRDAMVRIFKALFKFLMAPFIRTQRTLRISFAEIKKAKENQDKAEATRIKAAVVKDVLFGKQGLLVTLFNYAAPIISIVFLFSIISYVNDTSYAIKLSINGKMVGYIESEQVYSDAEMITTERITYAGGDGVKLDFSPEYSLEMLGNQQYITKFQLANMMLEMSDANIEYAIGVYIDGKFYGAVIENNAIENELERILDSYRTGKADEEVAFEQKISYEPGLFLSDSIVEDSEIIRLLNSEKQQASYYTVVEGDSPARISDKLGISISTLEEYNPEITKDDYMMRAGQKLLLEQSVPFLSVSIARTESYEVSVPYDTEYVTDDDHYEGVFTTVQEGESGTNKVTARVYYVNGIETRRTITKTQVVKEPVPEIISEGTLPPQSSHYSSDSVAYDRKYIWPVQNGDYWGGWGSYYGHTGVDIGGAYGADIYAGASGVVTYAGWDGGGYGNMVTILHPDGYTTLYGHCSEVFVYVGQEVTQGQCIAAVGQTGRAYGNHCHFEVRYGDQRLNPEYYLTGL
ncbi:MAG: peptidoglycan DD-metalloendopeptidase family protein [Eubacterium sp.]|nr:peptidoglycan DD-metalloendopeptidase family protein [Eubacterium sp.]